MEPDKRIPCHSNAPGARVTITNVASDDGYQPFMLCGQSLPPPVYSVGNSVQVIFTSLSSQYPGFNATYTAITYSSGTWYTLFIRHQRLSEDYKTSPTTTRHVKRDPGKSWILDSTLWTLDSRNWIPVVSGS